MSDTFGALYIQGQQLNLPGGGPQSVGPFALPASGVQSIVTVPVANDSNDVAVPTLAAGYAYDATGVVIIPPTGGTVPVQIALVINQYFYINPEYPSFIAFDPNNMPSNLYVKSTGTVAVVAQFL